MKTQIDVDAVIRLLGGPSAVAELCEMENPQAVSNWIARGRIPQSRLVYLRAIKPAAFSPKSSQERRGAVPDRRARTKGAS